MGDMGELGDHAHSSHVEIGNYARERGVRRLFATGSSESAHGGGFRRRCELVSRCGVAGARSGRGALPPAVTLLVKGSRSNRLERVVAQLTGAAAKEMH